MGYLLTLFSAIIYFLSFPPYSNGYLIFFSLIPFFITLANSDSTKKTIIYGVTWGTTISILYSIPLYNALVSEYNFSFIFSALLIIFTLYLPYAIIYCLFSLSFRYLSEKSGFYSPVIITSLWLIVDYIMNITPLFMPWGYAGYSQVFNTFIQISDITGIHGVTFLIVLVNSLLTNILYYKIKYLKLSIFSIILVIACSAVYGYQRKQNINQIIELSHESKITASIVQGNFRSKEKWDSRNTATIISTYINLTKQIIQNSNIIVWPETVLNSSDKNNLEIITGVSSLLNQKQIFITGATRNDNKNIVYNSILTANNHGLDYIYDKKILFPFTETSLAGLSSGNYMDSPSIFQRGKTKPIYNSEFAVCGFTICFEAIYPDYVRKIKNLGANVLINVANDSWFGNNYEPHMHLYSSIARAVENRFYVIRSSNSGISAIISPTGEIIETLGLNIRDHITAPIFPARIPTFYSKSGDWIIIFSLLVIIIALFFKIKI